MSHWQRERTVQAPGERADEELEETSAAGEANYGRREDEEAAGGARGEGGS